MSDWIDSFSRYFKVITADTPKLVEQALRLRYEIYCLEKGYENPDQFENNLEKDALDDDSAHGLMVFVPTDVPVGTVRLILPQVSHQNRLFPIEEHCEFTPTNEEYQKGHSILEKIDRIKIAEVSRFSISKSFRKRLGEANTIHGFADNEQALMKLKDRRFIPHLTVGLVKAMFQLSFENRMKYWFAVMEPKLRNSLLKRFYLQFYPLGPTVNYRGIRQPYIADIALTASEIRKNDVTLWDLLTNNGKYLS
jgi:N-acyl amino acid synthase of PEP-CTERM/exosortase system